MKSFIILKSNKRLKLIPLEKAKLRSARSHERREENVNNNNNNVNNEEENGGFIRITFSGERGEFLLSVAKILRSRMKLEK